jgi:hypothetical protein
LRNGLRGEPRSAVFTDQRDAFINRIYAMRNGEIDLAGQFVIFAEHRPATPFDEFGPHFSHEDERRVVKLADLQELPRKRQLQQSSNAAWDHHERVGDVLTSESSTQVTYHSSHPPASSLVTCHYFLVVSCQLSRGLIVGPFKISRAPRAGGARLSGGNSAYVLTYALSATADREADSSPRGTAERLNANVIRSR